MAWSDRSSGAKDGDWYCPTCADLQFRNNSECRHCGLSKEQGVAEITPDMFLQGHDVRAEAADEFRMMSPENQKLVIDRGTLKQARDPTAVLIKRMSSLGTSAGRIGDWWCPKCCDLQFAKNETCRNCGAAKVESAPGETPSAEAFLDGHDVEEEVKATFLGLDAAVQKAIIQRGSLRGANNPTAVLKSRITNAQNDGGGGKGGGKGKDPWGGWDGWAMDPWAMYGGKGKGGKGWDMWGGMGGWGGGGGGWGKGGGDWGYGPSISDIFRAGFQKGWGGDPYGGGSKGKGKGKK